MKNKLKSLKRQKEEEAVAEKAEFVGIDVRMDKAREDHEDWKKQRKEYERDKKKRKADELEKEQEDASYDPMMAMMGLPMGFK